MHTTTSTVFGDDPQLVIYKERVKDPVDIWCLQALQLLQYTDLILEIFDRLISVLYQGLGVVRRISIHDLEGHRLTVPKIHASQR